MDKGVMSIALAGMLVPVTVTGSFCLRTTQAVGTLSDERLWDWDGLAKHWHSRFFNTTQRGNRMRHGNLTKTALVIALAIIPVAKGSHDLEISQGAALDSNSFTIANAQAVLSEHACESPPLRTNEKISPCQFSMLTPADLAVLGQHPEMMQIGGVAGIDDKVALAGIIVGAIALSILIVAAI